MPSKLVSVARLAPGSILSESVMTANGKVLINNHAVLTTKMITSLENWNIQSVAIVDDAAVEDMPIEEPADVRGLAKEYEQFAENYESVVSSVTNSLDFIHRQKIIPIHMFRDTSNEIVISMEQSGTALVHRLLVTEGKMEDLVSRNAVTVAYLAGNLARHMNWSEKDIRGVILAGLLHDVGKIMLNKSEQPKPHAHIVEVAKLLTQVKGIPNEVVLGVVQHHEYVDGTGLPTRVPGDKIHPYAKLIGIVDIFQSAAFMKNYSNPFPALDILGSEMFGRLDLGMCQMFINQIKDSLMNTEVLLSDGRVGEVVFFHPTKAATPIVKTVNMEIVDLSVARGIRLERVLAPKAIVS